MNARRRAPVLVIALGALWSLGALGAVSCGAPLMKLPRLSSGAGEPAPDAADALAQATAACSAIHTLTAEVGVSGSANGRRVRGRLSAGVASPSSARLEAVAPFGAPLFIFVATGGDATLLLSRDNRVLEHGQPGRVLEAAAGVPLSAEDLHHVLTGCAPATAVRQARRYGGDWRVVTTVEGDELYLRRESSAWRLVAVVRHAESESAWRAEYREPRNGLPRSVHVVSVEAGRIGAAFDLRLDLSQVDTNVALPPEAFTVRIPPNATHMTLDELRHSGPLAAKSDDE